MQTLPDKQNPDGGWAYSKGCSWTEPTVLALLAQSASSPSNYLDLVARPDGGFSPTPAVNESNWVTALVTLLPSTVLDPARRRRALDWLRERTGRESGLRYRIQQRLAGNKDEYPEAWPWFPGAAAWTIPTSFGILAFERANSPGLTDRIASAKQFLYARQCADGGWNHGSNRALGRDGASYPETTGIALLALHRDKSSQSLQRAKTAAHRHLAACRSAEGIAWLRMGLAAHGEQATAPVMPARRTITDEALTALANAKTNPLIA